MSIINREQAEALIREQIVETIFQEAPKHSIVMQLGRRLPNMTSKQTKVPVLDMLPMAYWVNGDTGFKQTSKQAWDGVYLTAAELAVIVPIPEAVLSDASFDIMGEVTPRVNEAAGMRADGAIIFGNSRPVEWQNDIITLARQAGNNVSGGITYDTLMGEDGLLGKVEQAGYTVTGAIAAMRARGAMRGLKDDAGRPIFVSDMQGPTRYGLDGAPLFFPENGSFDTSVAQMVAGNWSQLVWAMRQDVTVKILDQGRNPGPHDKGNRVQPCSAGHDCAARGDAHGLGAAQPGHADECRPHERAVCLHRGRHARDGLCRHLYRTGQCFRRRERGARERQRRHQKDGCVRQGSVQPAQRHLPLYRESRGLPLDERRDRRK